MKYHNTETEVHLGDRVVYKHLLWGRSNGVVAYVPGVSPKHSNIGLDQWVIKLEGGKCVFMVFYPKLVYAHHRISFDGRGDASQAIKEDDPIF